MMSLALGGNAPHRTGGRTRVRRLLVCGLLMPVLLLHLGAASPSAPQVTVHETDGMYRVAARFTVPQPATLAVAVLTDYEGIPRFMPDVRTSRVLDRSADLIVVEQEAVAHMMMFSKRIHLVLEIQERPGTIRFRDRCAASFTHYEGGWTITEVSGHTTIEYALAARPNFDVPEFLLKRLLKRDSTEMIQRIQAEIATRDR